MGRSVSLTEVLEARETRARRQQELLCAYGRPLISFTMNIAGPVKTDPLIVRGFELGLRLVRAQLDGAGVGIVHHEQSRTDTGCEAFYVVDAAAEQVKRLVADIEDSMPVGRLFDLDVLAVQGQKLDRETLGYPSRKCLICENPARICGRSRAHSVQQLQDRTRQLLLEALQDQSATKIAALAQQSLLYEVCTTPKPGLVDRDNSGSHKDMDIFTFMTSASVLQPYFAECARIGMRTAQLPPRETLRQLRLPGRLAEQTMFAATHGVNTHKGAIFTMGLLCGAIGRLPEEQWASPEAVLSQCAAMAEGVTAELQGITAHSAKTAGQKLYVQYGITGVRGQAEQGFPAVLKAGLPVLEGGIAQGLSLNDAGCAALLALLAAATDTNLIARSSREMQLQVQETISRLFKCQPYPDRETLRALDAEFIQKNLSPGGSADLLAVTYFLYFLKQE